MSLTFRPVRDDDVAAICRWPQSADELYFFFPRARYPLTAEQLRQAIAERAEARVIERAGEPLGFANFHRWEQGGPCSIGNLVVAPTARRQGVARQLVQQMCALAFGRYQASEVRVSCFNHNTAGLLLYPALGFVPFALEERQGPTAERVALLHMRLPRNLWPSAQA